MEISLVLAQYIYNTYYNDLPIDVVEVTKRSFLDGLGTMIGASGLGEGCKEFVSLALSIGTKDESTIIGSDFKTSAYMAAFANGSMSHALDFEDYGFGVHANAAAIPAALAIAESVGNINGKDFITALALGCDIACRLSVARVQEDDPQGTGFYMPSILSSFGATAAASKLMNLSPEQIVGAFSFTLSQAISCAQVIHSPHSMIRGVRESFSAKSGVLSALLAEKGVSGFDQPIEGKSGFFTMYSNGEYYSQKLMDNLGKVFHGAYVSFKPWPSCAFTYPYIEETLQITNNYEINPEDIKKVTVFLAPNALEQMLFEPAETKRKPKTAIDAKFSIPFVIATALVYKKVSLEHFIPQALKDTRVLEIAKKITYEIDLDRANGKTKKGLVNIETKLNNIDSVRVEFVYGHPKNPMSWEALIAKFKNCASYSTKKINGENLDKIIALILNLEDIQDIHEITQLL